MRLSERFKRLTLWNKLGAVGALASVLALILAAPPLIQFLAERRVDAEATRGVDAAIRDAELYIADGRVSSARSLLAGLTPLERQDARVRALATAVSGLECFGAPSESCLAVLRPQIQAIKGSALALDVACLLQYRARSDTLSPADWFRQSRAANSSHPLVRLLISQQVGMSDPAFARGLLQTVIRDTTRLQQRCRLLVKSYYAIGKSYQAEGNWEQARDPWKDALRICGECPLAEDEVQADILYGLITAYANLGDADEEQGATADLAALAARGFSPGSSPWFGEAVKSWRNGEFSEAKRVMARVDAACRTADVFRENPYRCVYAAAFMAMCEIDGGTFQGNLVGDLRRAAAQFRQMRGGPFDQEVAWCELLLALAYRHEGRMTGAMQSFERATEIRAARGVGHYWPEDRWQQVSQLLSSQNGLTAR
jgi:tetratricopeptide (TPR) repeat protein